MEQKNTLKKEAGINDLVSLSLLPGGTQKIRDQLGIQSAKQYVEYIANTRNITLEEAKNHILQTPVLMKIMFMVA